MDAINKIGDKLLITSEEQLFYKKLSLCCDYTVGLFSELKDVVKEFHQELQIVDRQKAKRICIVLSSAALAQFEREDSTRARGEHEAAFRICAFFRLIHAKVILVPAAKERKEMQIAVDTMVVQEETAISEEPILPVPEPPMEPAKCTTRIISIHSADDSSAELVLTIFVDGIDQRFHGKYSSFSFVTNAVILSFYLVREICLLADEWMALKCSAFKKLVSVVQEEHCPVLSSPSTSEEQERLVLLLKGPTQYYYDQYGNFADFFKSKPDQYELRSESPVESVLESNASNFISCKCTIRTGKLIAGVNYKVSICFDKNLSESICLNFPQLKSSVEYSTRFDINPWLLRSHRADKELLELVLKNRLKLKPTFPSNIKGIQGRIVYWKDSQETCEGLGYRCYLNSDSQMVQGFEIITKLDWSQSIHDSPSHTLYELQRRIILVYNEISGENFLELTGWSGLDSKIADGKSVVKSVSRCECFDSLKISPLEFNAHVGKFIASYVGSNFSSIVSSTNTINSGFGEYIDTEVVLALDYQIRVRNSQGVGSFFNKSSLRISLGSIFLERNHLIEKGKVNLPKMNVAYFKLHNKVVQSPLQQSEVVLENAVAEKSQDQKWGISLQFLQAQSPLLK